MSRDIMRREGKPERKTTMVKWWKPIVLAALLGTLGWSVGWFISYGLANRPLADYTLDMPSFWYFTETTQMSNYDPVKRRKWKYVDIAPEIQERIKEVVKSGKYGFRSVAHFVDEAVKEYLRKLGYYP